MKMTTYEEKHSSSLRSINDSKSPTKFIQTLSEDFESINLKSDKETISNPITTKNFKNKKNILIKENTSEILEKINENKNTSFVNYHRKLKPENVNNNCFNVIEEKELNLNIENNGCRLKNKKINFNDFNQIIKINKEPSKELLEKNKKENFESTSLNLSQSNKINKNIFKEEKEDFLFKTDGEDLLEKIFNKTKEIQFSNKIGDVKQIKNLLKYLIRSEMEEKNDFIFSFLDNNFKNYRINVDLFNSFKIKKSNEYINLVDIVIEKILNSNNNKNHNIKLQLLDTIFSKIGCKKVTMEKIFQILINTCIKSKNEKYFGSYLALNNNPCLIFNSINVFKSIFCINSEQKFPKNYMYFNGVNGIQMIKKENDKISMQKINGFSFIFWFKIETNLMKENKKETRLITIEFENCDESKIYLSLLIKHGQLSIKTSKEDSINLPTHEFTNEWNFLFFSFKNFQNSNNEKIFGNYIINNNDNINEIFMNETNFKNSVITKIILFDKFIGFSTSFLFLNNSISEKNMINFRDLCKKYFPFGIYSETKLQKLLIKSSNKIMNFYQKKNKKLKKKRNIQINDTFNLNDITYAEIKNLNESTLSNFNIKNTNRFRTNSKIKDFYRASTSIKNLKSDISKQQKNTLKDILDKIEIFIVPFRSKIIKIEEEKELSKKENQKIILLDIKENYDFEFIREEDPKENIYKSEMKINYDSGISIFSKVQNNLKLLDSNGINNFIPLLELCLNCPSSFSKENILYYMKLIYLIIFDRERNMKNIVEMNFFTNASYYIEKIDCSFLDKDISKILIDIFKHLYSYNSKNQAYANFLEKILLNEKIILKLKINEQIEIWEMLYKYINESHELLKFFQIEKLFFIVILGL